MFNALEALSSVLMMNDVDSSSETLLDTATSNLEAGIISGVIDSITQEKPSNGEGKEVKQILPVAAGILLVVKILTAILGILAFQGAI